MKFKGGLINKKNGRRRLLGLLLVLLVSLGVYQYLTTPKELISLPASSQQLLKKTPPKGGQVVSVEAVQTVPADQVLALSRQNYGASAPQPSTAVTKALIKYTSYLPNNTKIEVYARAYIPSSGSNLPTLAFAPGTTGIGDQCAASLEQPAVSNWANYESHMMTYAGQGYASIITDYEGMRDVDRIHHYMIGEVEGRAVLDSLRALHNWDVTAGRLNDNGLFVGGFSQGGHSAMWADKIAADYAPEYKLRGVVGFGPVSDVKRTLVDVTRGANINWFGPFILTSYQDYYSRTYDVAAMLQPKWVPGLKSEVTSHCIDTVINHWGRDPAAVYTPALRTAMATDNWAGFEQLSKDLDANAVGDQKTTTAKLINQGAHDNVILVGQQQAVMPKLCANSKGPVNLRVYPGATHYNVMVQSFRDTTIWMQSIIGNRLPITNCS
ncbi:hypothetical protein EPO04_01325 [Patescibacteria group bacterium]|nr:MAG: hypothetical protein EPO04_01325 [Patescibacteria group bacterium]